MDNQDIFALWPQVLTELLVFLGRPTVQLQLAVVIIGLILATSVGQVIQNRFRLRFQEQIETAGFGQKFGYHLFLQLSNTTLALLFIQLMKFILQTQNARTALIDDLLRIILLFLLLKAFLAIALAVGETDHIKQYQKVWIIPLFVVIVGAQLLAVFFHSERLFDAPVFNLFDNTVTLSALFLVTIGLYLWVVGVNGISQGILYLVTRYGTADKGSTQATLTLMRYLLIMIGLVYGLFRLNFNTTTIAAISGGLSVGVGFALSTILSNFVSGILLLFERTLHPGDIIEYNGILSTVEMITMRSIRVRTFDNIEMIIPNSEFVTAPFTTYTGDTQHIRLRLPIGVSYDDDHKLVIKTLLEIAVAYPNIMKDPEPEVRLENFGDFTIDYLLLVWVSSPMIAAEVKNDLHQAILVAFAEKGITIPFPTAIEIIKSGDK